MTATSPAPASMVKASFFGCSTVAGRWYARNAATRISHDLGRSVVHVGVMWGMRYYSGLPAMELEDGTVIAIADVDPDSVVFNPTLAQAHGQARECTPGTPGARAAPHPTTYHRPATDEMGLSPTD